MSEGNRRWSVPQRRVWISIGLAVIAVFLICGSLGLGSWLVAAIGIAMLSASIGLYTISALNSRAFSFISGVAHVVSASEPPSSASFGRCQMQLVVHAKNIRGVAVKIRDAEVPVAKWPDAGQTLPIIVAINDPRRVRVLWDEIPNHYAANQEHNHAGVRGVDHAGVQGVDDYPYDPTPSRVPKELDDSYLGEDSVGADIDALVPRDGAEDDDGLYGDGFYGGGLDDGFGDDGFDDGADDDGSGDDGPGDGGSGDDGPSVGGAGDAGPAGGDGGEDSGDDGADPVDVSDPHGGRVIELDVMDPSLVRWSSTSGGTDGPDPLAAQGWAAPIPGSAGTPTSYGSTGTATWTGTSAPDGAAMSTGTATSTVATTRRRPSPRPRRAPDETIVAVSFADSTAGGTDGSDTADAPAGSVMTEVPGNTPDGDNTSRRSTAPGGRHAARTPAADEGATFGAFQKAGTERPFDAAKTVPLEINKALVMAPAVTATPDAPRGELFDQHADERSTGDVPVIDDAYLAATRPPGAAGIGRVRSVAVTLFVTDLSRSIIFYRDILGFNEIDAGHGSAVLESGDARIVLRRVDMAPVDRRLVQLLLEVPDIQAGYEDLRARGVTFIHRPRPVGRYEQMHLWQAAFRDPDGHGIAITQWLAPRDAPRDAR